MCAALPDLSPDELSRYSRHILLDEVGVDGQRRLAGSRVLLVGAGGLGSPAAVYLAAAGVGTLGIADFDRVELHNLQRQILHDTASVGAPKVESAARRLAAANPHVRIRLHPEGVTTANAVELFADYDLVVDGSDNFATRYLTNDAAYFARRPLVHGGIFKFEGQVSVFDPAHGGPCYRCLFPEPPPPGSVPGCGEVGVFGALCGVIGSLQAMEAIKLLLGIGRPLRGRLFVFDALAQQSRVLTFARDPACALCGDSPTIRALAPTGYATPCSTPPVAAAEEAPPDGYPLELPVDEAQRLLTGGALLLDVREPYEVQICRIAGSEHIPMRQVPERTADLPRDRHVLVLCHTGQRSRVVTDFLRRQGFNAVSNVAGGISAWADRIDPSLRRY